MKRKEPSSPTEPESPVFDAVYPYEVKRINLMPPFYDFNGFTEENNGTLSLKVSNPFSFDNKGNLELNLGNGLRVDEEGLLESDAKFSALATQAPLHYSSKNILQLLYSENEGLKINNNNELMIKISPPLTFIDGSINLLLNSSILSISDNKLTFKINDPFTISDTGLGINLGTGLLLQNNSLNVQLPDGEPPIVSDSKKIQLNYSNGLIVKEGVLQLNISDPFSISKNVLNLNIGSGLQINNKELQLKISNGLQFINDNLQLNFNENSALEFINNGIQIKVGDGLQIINNKLTLKIGNGLVIDNDNQALTLAAFNFIVNSPLKYENKTLSLLLGHVFSISSTGNLELKIGKGLIINNVTNALELKLGKGLQLLPTGELQLKLGPGLGFTAAGEITPRIALKLAQGLEQLPSSALQVKVGSGLHFSPEGNIIPNLGNGLELSSDHKIQIKVNEGLTNDEHGLKITNTPCIWWTGTNMENNTFEKQGRVFLCLSSFNTIVTGLVQIYFPIKIVNETLLFRLFFDKNGQLLEISDLTENDLINKNVSLPLNRMKFMPNKILYQKDVTEDAEENLNLQGMKYMNIPTYFNSKEKNDVLGHLRVYFNQEMSSVYSLVFSWGPIAATEFADEFIFTSMCQFTYISEE
ncbi:fiber [Bat mastadenovirus WIV13]|uniref:Fiber n=1 Tax=Bat mastadenovirus WIV13 TaxID=1788435 RepID=A0A1B0UHY4_9ADEN|nr:fiber [Bat mastadenovirus WIV13]AMB43040.1 fiber [Bat mastadenovirus WIV13]